MYVPRTRRISISSRVNHWIQTKVREMMTMMWTSKRQQKRLYDAVKLDPLILGVLSVLCLVIIRME